MPTVQRGSRPVTLSEAQILLLRADSQGLLPRGGADSLTPAQVLSTACGVQAQDPPSAALGVRIRSLGSGLTAQSIDHAQFVERSIFRGWFMRSTLHLISSEDARWLIPLLGPTFIQADARRMAQLGWNAETIPAGLRLLRDALTERGPLTRDAITDLLAQQHLPFAGQATIHLIARAALEGMICQGSQQGKKPAFALLEDWIGPLQPMPFDDALDRLARRYLVAFGPAGPLDMATWSGLKISQVRAAWRRIEDELIPVETVSGPLWLLEAQLDCLDRLPKDTLTVRLLPRFDNCLLAYHSRDLFLDPQPNTRITASNGMVPATLQVNGRILGFWKTIPTRGKLEVQIEPIQALDTGIWNGIDAEIQDVQRFLGARVQRSDA